MGPGGVVPVSELIELGLEVFEGARAGAGVEPAVEGLVEAFDLALGLGVSGAAVLRRIRWACNNFSKPLRAPLRTAKRAVKTSPLSVSVEAGGPFVLIRVFIASTTRGPENAAEAWRWSR